MTKLQSICVAFSCLLLAPLAHAQPAKLQRIGVIHEGGPYEATVQGMVAGLKQSGLVEGKHFLLHVRDLKGSLRDIEGVAKQLVSERVDLLFTVTTSVTLAAKKVVESWRPYLEGRIGKDFAELTRHIRDQDMVVINGFIGNDDEFRVPARLVIEEAAVE